MLILITGGAASGKSEFGENLCTALSGEKLYIATMQPFGEEALSRIKRHTEMRKAKGFSTLEKYTKISECNVNSFDTILLECMSTLLANEYFQNKSYFENIISGIEMLQLKCKNFVVITNKIFSDGITYENETMEYIKALGKINLNLTTKADVVIEVVCGIPVVLKGEDKISEYIKKLDN